MVRWSTLSAGAVVVIAAAFVTGASVPPHQIEQPAKHDIVKGIPAMGQKMGFFNMAKVMREYKRAQNSVQRLRERKESITRNLVGMRQMFLELQNAPKDLDTNHKMQQERVFRDKIMLGRKIEDTDREINRLLNSQASELIAELYDEIHAMTTELAAERGLGVVYAYPDAATPEERDNPLVKELKLKPPACMPFYLDPSLDYSDELIERLNAKCADEPN